MTDLAELAADIVWPDHDASTRAHDHVIGNPLLVALGSHVEWLAAAQGQFPPHEIRAARLIVFVADHGIAEAGVSAFGAGATAKRVGDIRRGGSRLNALAELAGVTVRLVETDVLPNRIDLGPALTPEQVAAAVAVGAAIADEEIDAGCDLLIAANLGTASTTSAAALIAVLTGSEPVKVVGRGGSRIDDFGWMRKVTAIRDARRLGWAHRSSPMDLLAAIGGPDTAALAGFLLRAAARRTPVLLDGLVAAAAGVLATMEAPFAARWWRAAQVTGEPAQLLALSRLDLPALADLGMATGDGSGALVALGILRAAVAATTEYPQATTTEYPQATTTEYPQVGIEPPPSADVGLHEGRGDDPDLRPPAPDVQAQFGALGDASR